MQEHDYDPTTDDFHKFVDWVERRCELFDNVDRNSKPDEKPASRKGGKRKNDKQPEGENPKFSHPNPKKRPCKYCMHYKWCDHTTEECKVVQAQMKKVPPHQKAARKPSKDMLSVELFKNKEFYAIIKDNVERSCSKMFKAFRK